jgi:MtN3 and saliva related transmembrane protein
MAHISPFLVSAFGVGAGLCSMVSFVPQLVKLIRERDAAGVSLRMYLVTVAGFALWIAYGATSGAWLVAASNAINLSLAGAILAMKMRLDARP